MTCGLWAGRGEFDCQQGWKMTIRQGGVENDCWVGRGEFDCQQGLTKTTRRRGVNMTASRGGG